MLLMLFICLIVLVVFATITALDMNIRRSKEVEDEIIVNRTIICFIALSINFLFRKHIEAVLNPFTNRIHCVYKDTFNCITSESVLYKHQYVHILQNKKLGWFKFIILYLINSMHSYANNVFEKQAFKWQYMDINIDAVNKELDNKLAEYKGK